jgi:hypothetical protein
MDAHLPEVVAEARFELRADGARERPAARRAPRGRAGGRYGLLSESSAHRR